MKFHWGYFAFGLFGLYVILMLSMVFYASKQNSELVKENYYEEELSFIENKEKKDRTATLSSKMLVKQDGEWLKITFPEELSKISGNAYFMRPSGKKDDLRVNFEPNALRKGVLKIPVDKLKKGKFQLQLNWTAKTPNQDQLLEYLHEESLFIQ